MRRSNTFNATHPFYMSNFYLISPTHDRTFMEYFSMIGRPFSLQVWLGIVFAIAYVGMTMSVIRNKSLSRVKLSNCKNFSSWTYALYTSLRSFISGEPADSDHLSSAEHVVMIGFIIFSVLIITAFTATATAFIVLSSSDVTYSSIYDVMEDDDARVCSYESIQDNLLYDYPALRHQLIYPKLSSESPEDFLGLLFRDKNDERRCDAIIMNSEEYEYIILSTDKEFCKRTKIITNKVLAEVEVVNLFRTNLDTTKSQILYEINRYMKDNRYKHFRDVYRASFSRAKFDKSLATSFADELMSTDSSHSRILATSKEQFQYLESGYSSDTTESLCGANTSALRPFSVKQLSSPFLITFACTTLGLIMWFCSSLQKRFRCTQRLREIWCGSSNLDSEERAKLERARIRMKYTGQPLSYLLGEIRKCDVDEADIENAFNKLPDDTAIVDILVNQKMNTEIAEYQKLKDMTAYRLYTVLEQCPVTCDGSTNLAISFDEFARQTNAKDELVQRVMMNPRAKKRALYGGMEEENDSESESQTSVSYEQEYLTVSKKGSKHGMVIVSSETDKVSNEVARLVVNDSRSRNWDWYSDIENTFISHSQNTNNADTASTCDDNTNSPSSYID